MFDVKEKYLCKNNHTEIDLIYISDIIFRIHYFLNQSLYTKCMTIFQFHFSYRMTNLYGLVFNFMKLSNFFISFGRTEKMKQNEIFLDSYHEVMIDKHLSLFFREQVLFFCEIPVNRRRL